MIDLDALFLAQGLNCVGYETITLDTNPKGFSSIPKNAKNALLVCEANDSSTGIVARFREDGNDPSNVDGMPLVNLGIYGIRKGCLSTFKAVSTDSNNQTIRVSFYG